MIGDGVVRPPTEDLLVAARWGVSLAVARRWLWLRWLMATDRLLGDGWICSPCSDGCS